MIKQLQGTILDVQDQYIVIEPSRGIGLQVFVPDPGLYSVGESFHLFTTMIVRENNISLYGFSSTAQESVFKTLLSIPKVGAKMALAILYSFSLQELFNIVEEGIPETLTKATGVGKTTARKIHLFLSEKWKDELPAQSLEESPPDCYTEAHDMLLELGLQPTESKQILRQLRQKGSTASTPEEIVKEVLKNRKTNG